MRRIVALVLVVGVMFGMWSVVSGLFGGDDTSANEPITPSTNTVVNDGVTPTTLPPTTTTTPPPKEKTVPSAEDPAEVLILGDSDAGAFGPYLKTLLDQTGIASTELEYKTSSGLARPDFFDWPAFMREIVPQANPDIVVVTFGGNDAQGLRNLDLSWAVGHNPGEGQDDTDWKAEYGARVGAAMDYLTEGTRTLVWVGVPNASDPALTARLAVQDEVVRAEAAKRTDKVVFVDTWARFSGRNGGWAEYVIDPRDGEGKDVRADDGFHLNVNGAEILALDIAEAVKTDMRDRGATI
ncbi:MAG: DUF459 domain-containing protein [Actinobacteria bacterium]|nr:DUF459 domain-containing protein [Actinomycetota bacterium]